MKVNLFRRTYHYLVNLNSKTYFFFGTKTYGIGTQHRHQKFDFKIASEYLTMLKASVCRDLVLRGSSYLFFFRARLTTLRDDFALFPGSTIRDGAMPHDNDDRSFREAI